MTMIGGLAVSSCVARLRCFGAMSQRPFSASPNRPAKHAAEHHGQHNQSIEPLRPTKAAVLQSPISA
jgi:hypothetical protein